MKRKASDNYLEKLRDPQWQKKRLEIMERDDFACKRCDSNDHTLNVHHSYYEKGKSPWEYPCYSLHTLCEDCHEIIQAELTTLHRAIGLLTFEQIEELTGYACGLSINDRFANDTPPVVALTSASDVDGFVRALMTHNGRGVLESFKTAADRIISLLISRQDDDREIGFLEAIELCQPQDDPDLVAVGHEAINPSAYEWI